MQNSASIDVVIKLSYQIGVYVFFFLKKNKKKAKHCFDVKCQ